MAAAALLALLLAVPETAFAIRTEIQPPAITVLVNGAPRDLTLTLHIMKNGADIPVPLFYQRVCWETCYRFYRDEVWEIRAWFGNLSDLKDAVITASSGGVDKTIPLPEEGLSSIDDRFTLNWGKGTITAGLPVWRAPLLAAMRIAAGLAIEGLFFWFYGYRNRRTWLVLCAVNLVSLGFWSWFVRDWINARDLTLILLIVLGMVFYVAELIAFILLVNEYDRNRTVTCAARANLVSFLAEIAMLLFLPA